MIEHLFLEFYLLPFEICFFIGLILIVLAPISYRKRTKVIILKPNDLLRYKRREKQMLIFGAILMLVGIIGIAKLDDKYGHYVTVIDKNGNSTVVREKW